MKFDKTNAMRILDRAKTEYEYFTYDASDGNIDGISVAKKMNQNPKFVYKTLVTVGHSKNHYVFVIPVEAELNLKAAAKAVGEKNVEMIHVAEINKITGYIRGGCSPVGMKKQFVTVADSSAEELPYFFVSGGRIGLQIKVCPADLQKLINMKFGDIIYHRE